MATKTSRIPRNLNFLGFFGGNFLFRISEYTQRESKLSFRKLQIVISQIDCKTVGFFLKISKEIGKVCVRIRKNTDCFAVYFANYRLSFRKLQIFISQTADFHFANYRFSFRKLQIFISFRFANYGKPYLATCELSRHFR